MNMTIASYKIKEIHRCCDKLINSKNISINAETMVKMSIIADNTYS